MSDIVTVEAIETKPSAQVNLFDMSPKAKVAHVAEMANLLAGIIEKQKMYSEIQGKKYVKVESWIALGTMLGIVPKEKHVEELADGSYVAEVELVRFDNSSVIGGASALCSITEKRWANADKYARRSMAVTRATGKAFRLAFAWVIAMAGYAPTPAEEMEPTQDENLNEVEYDPSISNHKKILGYIFEALDFKDRDFMSKCSDACKGLKMRQLPAAVKEALKDGIS